jgi:hypothetical protein|tara:strand:- start:1384 stop:1635 length:252 start_codon:yes stop_codon:yes gene_type:complete
VCFFQEECVKPRVGENVFATSEGGAAEVDVGYIFSIQNGSGDLPFLELPLKYKRLVVPEAGLEPARFLRRGILNPSRIIISQC